MEYQLQRDWKVKTSLENTDAVHPWFWLIDKYHCIRSPEQQLYSFILKPWLIKMVEKLFFGDTCCQVQLQLQLQLQLELRLALIPISPATPTHPATEKVFEHHLDCV